jgi:dTDP-glucose 4,6-dehydratase
VQIFVTGGAGFIGSAHARALPQDEYAGAAGAAVTVLDSLSYSGNRAGLPLTDSRLRLVQGDISDSARLTDLLAGHDAVVPFAAESDVDRSIGGAVSLATTARSAGIGRGGA